MAFNAVMVSFVLLFCCCIASPMDRKKREHMSVCDLEGVCGSHGVCKTDEDGAAFCECDNGFTGKCCDTFAPKRCKLYSEKAHENAVQHTCDQGFWCIPDNFYCHFHRCENSVGWCLPVAEEAAVDNCKRYENLLQ